MKKVRSEDTYGGPSYFKKYVEALERGTISFEEFCETVLEALVSYVGDVEQSIQEIPRELLAKFFQFLEVKLVPMDFMPDPCGFVVNSRDESEVQRVRQQMRA